MNEVEDKLAAILASSVIVTHANDVVFERVSHQPLHAPTIRLILVVDGSLTYELGGQTLQLVSKDLLLVPAWSVRQWSLAPGEQCHLAWCEFMLNPAPVLGLPAIKGRMQPCDRSSIERIMLAISQKRPLLAEGEAKALLARTFSGNVEIVSHTTAYHESTNIAIEQALTWLHLNYHKVVTLEDMAVRANQSERQFRQQFLDYVSMTPRQYLTSLRMHHAQLLLRDGAQSVKQVALQVGYRDQLYFSRHYHAYWGHAPTQQRFQHDNAPKNARSAAPPVKSQFTSTDRRR